MLRHLISAKASSTMALDASIDGTIETLTVVEMCLLVTETIGVSSE
jgi:hypothetical protein